MALSLSPKPPAAPQAIDGGHDNAPEDDGRGETKLYNFVGVAGCSRCVKENASCVSVCVRVCLLTQSDFSSSRGRLDKMSKMSVDNPSHVIRIC